MEQLQFPRLAEEASAECRYELIEARILELADCFAVSVYAFAVMTNHALGDEEVTRRWLTALPGVLKHDGSEELAERRMLASPPIPNGSPGQPELVRESPQRADCS